MLRGEQVEREEQVHPTLDDGTVAALSEVVGGPMGSRAGRHWWWTPVRVLLLLTAVTFALGMVTKVSCVESDWQDNTERFSHMCYSDMPYLYQGRGLADLAWPYTDDAEVRAQYEVMEYPVGISYWAWGTAYVTHWLSGSPDLDDPGRDRVAEGTFYVAVNAIGLALVALLSTALLAGVNRRRPWDAAGFALAPALALTGLVNWDLLAVVFVAGALWAWARERPVLTGVMIGLGTAVKLFPLLLLGGIFVLCLRRRRWAQLVATTSGAVLAWVVANVPALLTGPEEWKRFWSFNSERTADLGSVWLFLQQGPLADTQLNPTTGVSERVDHFFTADTINQFSWLFLLVWCLAVLVIGLKAPQAPRLAQLGFLVVAGFLLINKVYSPQYVLWLLPLAVMARPRWRDLLIWQAGELLYFASVWWYLGDFLAPGDGGPVVFYWIAIGLRMLAELYLVVLVVRDVLRPEHDPVDREPWDLPDLPDSGEPQATTTRSNVVAV
ncbi:glycosyltransferase 87 family protein [Nocardioides sp. 616]|uniref:glycosyltransferase family 87 protein n=1 Tax=Nocardioides sp. 616 TaxID=2268090 RepID=UPI000CE53631|nr:glycosyltransferase 87 family protein [Nocardioides sp. 616]